MACGKKGHKSCFVRINRTPKSKVNVKVKVISPKKSLEFFEGRSAYICFDFLCLKKVQKTRRLEKLLLCKCDDDLYLRIGTILNDSNRIIMGGNM